MTVNSEWQLRNQLDCKKWFIILQYVTEEKVIFFHYWVKVKSGRWSKSILSYCMYRPNGWEKPLWWKIRPCVKRHCLWLEDVPYWVKKKIKNTNIQSHQCFLSPGMHKVQNYTKTTPGQTPVVSALSSLCRQRTWIPLIGLCPPYSIFGLELILSIFVKYYI